MKDDKESAFPVVGMSQRAGQEFMGVFEHGLTKREWFAGMALSGGCKPSDVGEGKTCEQIAFGVFKLADAMIKESQK